MNESIRGGVLPKDPGLYELELVPVFEQLFKHNIDRFMDVGAAEGDYAVGLALRFPGSPVIAVEATEEGRELLRQVIASNGLAKQVQMRGLRDAPTLKAETDACDPNVQHLSVMDVEAAKNELPRLHAPEDLRNFPIVIELHDPLHTAAIIEARQRKLSDLTLPQARLTWLCLSPGLLSWSRERRLPMRRVVFQPKAP